jgi:hypothetical protein
MASLGMSKLQAVNELLEAINELPVAALDSTGTWPALSYGSSEAGRAEMLLDRESQRFQSRGWPDNTDLCKFFALNAATNTKLDLSASPYAALSYIHVRAAGPQHWLDVSLRNGLVWNNQLHTDVLTGVAVTVSGSVGVYLDAVRYIDFAELSPRLKDAIIAHSKVVYQRRTRQSPLQDGFLSQEAGIATVLTNPVQAKRDGQPLSPWPLIPQAQQQQNQQGQ